MALWQITPFSSLGAPVDDDKCRRLQATFDEIVEDHQPGCLAFAAHVLDRQVALENCFPPTVFESKIPCRWPSLASAEPLALSSYSPPAA